MERIHRRTGKKKKKTLYELDYYSGVVSHPEPDILDCEGRWALGSIAVNKTSGCKRIPVELFRTLKDDAIKALHSIYQQIWKIQQWSQNWKWSILIPFPKKGSTKECANHWTIALIFHATKVMLKILTARLHHCANQELPDVQAGFRRGRGTRDQIDNIHWIIQKTGEFQKNIYLCFIEYPKAFVWIITNCGKLLKRWEYQTILLFS